jgi:hypothetical protein
VMAFPHHIGYKQGQRGINWATFDAAYAPVVEIISMHGCSEANEGPRPFLHSMGPSDHRSTYRYGLAQGHIAGAIGSTDHHSAHPGSYGHGRTGLWAREKTREAIWEALWARRTYALTGDRIELRFALNDQPMGTVVTAAPEREVAFHVVGGAPLDYVDIIKNGALLRRYSAAPPPLGGARGEGSAQPPDPVHTKLLLELGWGARGVRVDWDVHFGISEGHLLAIEPRFRGAEVVAPQEADPNVHQRNHTSHWMRDGNQSVRFTTVTHGNPNNMTPATQGMCLDVEVPVDGEVWADINGRHVRFPVRHLLEGARAGRLGEIDSPAFRFHRAPRWEELEWRGSFADTEATPYDVYYLRVRQANDQWAWSSPIWVRE